MSVQSIDVTQVAEIVDNTGYPVMFEMYESRPLVYPVFSRSQTPESLASPFYGEKGSVIEGMEPLLEREDGQDIEMSTFETAYTWYMKCRQFSRGISIPARLLRSSDNLGKVGSMIAEAARGWGQVSVLQKENFFADMFQKGTLTAGSRPFFDGSFPNNTDPNPTVIYDALPFFDTAHTITGGSSTYANHVVSSALTAANLQTALIAMTDTNAVNERGERIFIRPTHLMVPTALEYTAATILNTTLLPGSANNDVNAVRRAGLQLLVNPALDDAASASAWWLVTAGESLSIVDSGAPRIRTFQERNGDISVLAEMQYGGTVKNWRHSYCANKAAS